MCVIRVHVPRVHTMMVSFLVVSLKSPFVGGEKLEVSRRAVSPRKEIDREKDVESAG